MTDDSTAAPLTGPSRSGGWRFVTANPFERIFKYRYLFSSSNYSAIALSPVVLVSRCLMDTEYFEEPDIKQLNKTLSRHVRLLVLRLAVVFIVMAALIVILFTDQQASWQQLAGIYALSAANAWTVTFNGRMLIKDKLAVRLLELLFVIEFNPTKWSQPLGQRVNALRVERVARLLEDIYKSYGAQKVSGTGAVVSGRALRIAEHFRGYGLWIAFPMANTYDDIRREIVHHIDLVLRDKWFLLPQAELQIDLKRNRWERAGLYALVVVLSAGLLAMLIWHGAFGATGTVVSSVLGIAIVLVLAKLGLSISALQQAADATKTAGVSK